MTPYFLLVALPSILYLVSKKYRITAGNKLLYETDKASINVFMFIFMLLLACRGLKCGADTMGYMHWYSVYSSQSLVSLLKNYENEFGYRMLNKVVGMLASDFQALLIVTAIICVCPLWYFYKKESENQLLTISLFLSVAPFIMYFSGIRQAIAMGLGIPAWYAAKNKKLITFILIVILALQFHSSAFILFAIYPLYYAKITKKWLWFVVPGILGVFIYRVPIFMFLLRFLWEEYEATPETGATTILLLLILFAIYSYVIPDDKLLDDDTIALRNILLLSVVIQIFAMLHPLSMRMNYYFLIFVPVLIPKIASRAKKGFAKVTQLSTIIMTAYFMYYFVNKVIKDIDPLNVFPYIPFWKN